jgi:hypothetical protein
MSPASPIDVFWNGEMVGSLLEGEIETVGVPYVRQPDGTLRLGPPSQVKVHGRWSATERTAALDEFLTSLQTTGHCEVSVEPYSSHMTVIFALSPDGTGWLHCTPRS